MADEGMTDKEEAIARLKADDGSWKIEVVPLKPSCPNCNSDHTQKYGLRRKIQEAVQRYWCYDCGHIFCKPISSK